MIELKTADGTLKWKMGKKLKGDETALEVFRRPRSGVFGAAPGLPSIKAHRQRESFLHLARTIWPDYQMVVDTEPAN